MNSLSFSLSELNRFILKHSYACYKAFIDYLLIFLFILNILLLIGFIIYLEIILVLFLMQQFNLVASLETILLHRSTLITVLIISTTLLILSLLHIRSSRQSLLDWLNSHRINNLFTSNKKSPKTEKVKDDEYWGNFYYHRAEKFRYGEGVNENLQYAIKLYQAAAKLNHIKAQISLSYLLLVNKGHKHNSSQTEAFSWALNASQYNEPEAWYNLGHMYKHGIGTAKNIPKALNAFEQAIYNGFYNIEKSGAAYYELGILYLNNTDMGPNYIKAINWLTKAVACDYPGANKALQRAFKLNKQADSAKINENPKKNRVESKTKKQATEFKVSCPGCETKLVIPNPIPIGHSICSKCFAKFSLKKDKFGNLQVYIPATNSIKIEEEKLPQTKQEAREILSVITQAGKTCIKQAYKLKMSEYHPDRVNNLGIKLKWVAEQETKRINAAYKLLKPSA